MINKELSQLIDLMVVEWKEHKDFPVMPTDRLVYLIEEGLNILEHNCRDTQKKMESQLRHAEGLQKFADELE